MPLIERKVHESEASQEEDVIVKIGHFSLYFQNYYTIISLVNDILTGFMYLAGSIVQLYFDWYTVGMHLFILASFFLLMRPVLKILHNIHVYNKKKYRKEVHTEQKNDIKSNKGNPDKSTNEIEIKEDESNREVQKKDQMKR